MYQGNNNNSPVFHNNEINLETTTTKEKKCMDNKVAVENTGTLLSKMIIFKFNQDLSRNQPDVED